MPVKLAEMTREQIRSIAPDAVAVLPTASVEQHGPHLPVLTDTILCTGVAEKAAARANESARVVVAPTLCYGRSHHHRPFPGVLSLSTQAYMLALADLLEGLVLSGFNKIIVLNGHGGNSQPNAVVCADFVQEHQLAMAYASYWDIARDAIASQGIMPADQIPGHAGRFETAMIMALRPDLVNEEALDSMAGCTDSQVEVSRSLAGGTVHVHGAWAASPGYTDRPWMASPVDGQNMLDIVVGEVAAFMIDFADAD